jgi:D-lactate dehydrogenase
MKIAVFSANAYELTFITKAFQNQHELIFINAALDEQSADLAEGCKAVMLFTSDSAGATVLTKLSEKGVKYIGLRSVGYDHVDLNVANRLHLRVANVPSYSPYSVAEHAVLLLLALNRKLLSGQDLIKKNDFRLNGLIGFDVHEKTVGVVGLGRIGRVFSKIMNGFGCRVLCYDPQPDVSLEKEMSLKFVSFKELCEQSDIISIHCPLSKESKHMFNKAVFEQLKPNVYIINTSRGAVIKTDDLLEALEQGKIGAVGLDVYEFEKGLFFQDHRSHQLNDLLFEKLHAYANVIITGHQAFLTENALNNIAETSFYNLDRFENGLSCENELHPKSN